MTVRIYEVLDRAIGWVGEPAHEVAVGAARAEYDERRGRVFEDEQLWESWTQAFLEWYVLEHVSEDEIMPLAARRIPGASAEDADCLRAWLRSQRTIVHITSHKGEMLHVVDLLGGAEFPVTEQRALAGVNAGDVAEVRLVASGDQVRFGRTFCFHPSGTRSAITKRIAELRDSGTERTRIIDHFARLRIRCERYSHLPPQRIYESSDDNVPDGGMRL